MPGPKILIIGGGLGGLTLAQSLRSQGIDFEIFERDEDPHSRLQGWAVSLKWVIPHLQRIVPKEAPSLESASVSWGKPGLDSAVIYDACTKKPVDIGISWETGTFIRVNRSKFRSYLLTGIPIKWGHRFTHYEVGEDNTVTAFFEDGSMATGDILVGADGLHSPVRHTLYQPNPPELNLVPVGVIVGEVTLTREQIDRQTSIARSMYLCVGNGFKLFVGLKSYSEDLSEGNYYWFLFSPADPAQIPDKASPEELLAFVKETLKDIHPDFKEIIESQKPERMLKPLIMFDRVPKICPPGPVTLIGDASHPMTPLRGEGANNAMQDAIELGERLGEAVAAGTSYTDALRAYEAAMVPRATQSVLLSRELATSKLAKL